MANPFLFMEEEISAATAVTDQNPFLIEDDDENIEDFPSENPFSASNPFAFSDTNDSGIATDINTDQSGANFFLAEDDDDEDEQMQQVDPTMSFFGTTINENDIDHDEVMKTIPPNRPAPATQQMISNLADHLDQTSTSLLGKIPVTRSPSPVSMRDLHSPDVGDLLDVSDSFAAASENYQEINEIVHEEQKPNRPPPPRPLPPRPTPPKTASTPTQPTATITQTNAQPHEDDLFDIHGVGHKKPPPKPPAPKSKEDILNLYQAPSQPEKKADLLSDDIDFTMQQQPQQQQQSNVAVVQPFVNEQIVIPQAIVEPNVHHEIPKPAENHVSPMNQEIPTITEDLAEDRHQSYFMDPPEAEEPMQQKSELSSDHSPTESGITSGGIPASNSGSIVNMAMQEMEVEPMQTNQVEFTDKTPTPQKEQLTFLTQKHENYQGQRPTTPDPIVAQPELAPIFNIGGAPEVSPQVKPAKPPPPPVRGGSVLTTVSPQPTSNPSPQQQTYQSSSIPQIQHTDEFDDFAAKFESTGATKSTGNAFLDSLGGNEESADAWGDSSDAFGATTQNSDGFGADDGFDTWEPPVVPESTPYAQRKHSTGSNEAINVTIKPKGDYDYSNVTAPALVPPTKSPYYSGSELSGEKINSRFEK